MEKTFGQFIRQKRDEKELELRELAGKVIVHDRPLATSSLSRYERDGVYISWKVGKEILKALGLSPSEMEEGKRLLDHHIDTFVPSTPYKKSGDALKRVLKLGKLDAKHSMKELSEHLDVYYQFIRDCTLGTKAFPPKDFGKLVEWLKSNGVKRSDIAELKRTYVKDLVLNNKQLASLFSKAEQQKVAEFAASLFE